MGKKTLVLVLAMALITVGCQTHMHTVGKGAQGSQVETNRQWYCIWGLVPINELDTQSIAGTEDYDIETEITFIDFLIAIPGCFVTVNSRTVFVTK